MKGNIKGRRYSSKEPRGRCDSRNFVREIILKTDNPHEQAMLAVLSNTLFNPSLGSNILRWALRKAVKMHLKQIGGIYGLKLKDDGSFTSVEKQTSETKTVERVATNKAGDSRRKAEHGDVRVPVAKRARGSATKAPRRTRKQSGK